MSNDITKIHLHIEETQNETRTWASRITLQLGPHGLRPAWEEGDNFLGGCGDLRYDAAHAAISRANANLKAHGTPTRDQLEAEGEIVLGSAEEAGATKKWGDAKKIERRIKAEVRMRRFWVSIDDAPRTCQGYAETRTQWEPIPSTMTEGKYATAR